jgi:hypothetical protein
MRSLGAENTSSLLHRAKSPPLDATRENSISCLIYSGLFFMGGLIFVVEVR